MVNPMISQIPASTWLFPDQLVILLGRPLFLPESIPASVVSELLCYLVPVQLPSARGLLSLHPGLITSHLLSRYIPFPCPPSYRGWPFFCVTANETIMSVIRCKQVLSEIGRARLSDYQDEHGVIRPLERDVPNPATIESVEYRWNPI